MNLQHVVLLIAIVSMALPMAAVFVRVRSRRLLMISTLLTALAAAAHLGIVLKLLALAPQYTANGWVTALVASPAAVLLFGYLLSISFGRDQAVQSLLDSRRTLGFLVVLSGVFLALLGHKEFITGYEWYDGRGTVHFGYLGKAYLSFLLIGIVLVGHNLERTYRVSDGEQRSRIRPAVLGLFGVLAFFTFILATGILYSTIGMGRLIAAGIPIACAAVLMAHGHLHGSISDTAAPVSRSFVYTSFTAMAAGLFVLSIGIAAQFATLTRWSPDEILIFAFLFLALLITVLLSVSNRFQRRVRRFIDSNFYVNRYDYRAQWSRLTRLLEDTADREVLLERVSQFLLEGFLAQEVTIALRDQATHQIRPVKGKGAMGSSVVLVPESPLYERLLKERRPLLLNRRPDDFTYVGIYAEDEAWLDATASRLIAPMLHGTELLGTIGLQRSAEADRFTFEDASMLDSISAHVGAALQSLRLASELAETRETELLSQWSSMTLHDLKNYLTPLRLASANLEERAGDAQVAGICAASVRKVADRIDNLIGTLNQLRATSRLDMGQVDPNEVVRDAVSVLQADQRPSLKLELDLQAQTKVRADYGMLRRVLENLVVNAGEAMDGSGTIQVQTRDDGEGDRPRVYLSVRDNGPGMDPEFLRNRLFRPFATTKKKGLGIGLWQCRMIIQAHGGEISVESRPGEGTAFHIALKGVPPVAGIDETQQLQTVQISRGANEVATGS